MIRKKTKIVATISDKNCDVEFLRKLYKAGMNAVRMNTAHQDIDDTIKIINNVKKVSDRIALILDTKGPEIRTNCSEKGLKVTVGDTVYIKGSPGEPSTGNVVCISYEGIAKAAPVNHLILIDDGDIELLVREKRDNIVVCEAMNSGIIEGRKSLNIPSVNIPLPSITDKDRDYILLAIKEDIDFIAHSFVRSKEDVLEIQKILDQHNSRVKIIAKIENQAGVNNIDEILDHCYGVMVARGDLAIEIPYAKIPGIQKMLINKCIRRRKPVIIATQMLHSMIKNHRPTRAEVSDIANAIYSHADAIMLSGETAYGAYPLESVETMARVAIEVEKTKDQIIDIPVDTINNEISAYLIKSAVEAAVTLKAKAILADSISGKTIRSLAAYRGGRLIYAKCYDQRVVRELAISYGVHARFMTLRKTSHEFIQNAVTTLLNEGIVYDDSLLVVIAGNFGLYQGPSYVEIGAVSNLANIGNLV